MVAVLRNKYLYLAIIFVILLVIAFKFGRITGMHSLTEINETNQTIENTELICNTTILKDFTMICERDKETPLGICEPFDFDYSVKETKCYYDENRNSAVVNCVFSNFEESGGMYRIEYGFLIDKSRDNESTVNRLYWLPKETKQTFEKIDRISKDKFLGCICRATPPIGIICNNRTVYADQGCVLMAKLITTYECN